MMARRPSGTSVERHLLATLREDLMADLEELESSLKDTELVER